MRSFFKRRLRLSALAILGPWLLVVAAEAQDPATLQPLPRAGDTVEWYVVRPGDTLEALTLQYLGTSRLWRENYRLNPQVRDPNLLSTGSRLRLITHRPPEGREAEVTQVARRVENQLFPDRVEPAHVGDRLKERDGIRTYEDSSAELAFEDTSRLVVGENSLILLQQVNQTLVGVRREAIEIRQGQAEVSARPATSTPHEIEIIVGATRARPRPGASEASQTRARRPADGGAAVMVYGGASEVEAAGQRVEVPKGMGTAVPEAGPPAPPEVLLPAAALLAPGAGEALGYGNPVFTWEVVAGAASYTIELCEDEGCTRLLARESDLPGPRWEPDRLAAGRHFWRVTAVSPSGLDGFPSAARPLELLTGEPDQEAPVVALVLAGPGQITAQGHAALALGGGLWPHARDDLSGVAQIRYRWNGGPWQVWSEEVLRPPGADAAATLETCATDRRGRLSAVWSVQVELLAQRPPAPEVHWSP